MPPSKTALYPRSVANRRSGGGLLDRCQVGISQQGDRREQPARGVVRRRDGETHIALVADIADLAHLVIVVALERRRHFRRASCQLTNQRVVGKPPRVRTTANAAVPTHPPERP